MSDLYEVERALVSLIANVLFPGVSYSRGSVATSVLGTPMKLYRGWPEGGALKTDLKAGIPNITIFPLDGMTRNVTRFFAEPGVSVATLPTITATVSGANVTFGGTVTAGNVVGIQFGAPTATQAFAYIVTATDTLVSIASALAAKITGASATGAVLTLPSSLDATVAVMVPQSVLTMTRQQDQGIRVTVWAQTPQVRDGVSAIIDAGIANLRDANGNLTERFTIKPGENGWIRYLRTGADDKAVRDGVWRRDLFYNVQYATTAIETDPTMLFGGGSLTITPPQVGYFGAFMPEQFMLDSSVLDAGDVLE